MKRYELIALLSELARQGCAKKPVKIDRVLIASNLEVSAWTLSKWLRRVVEEGYVETFSKGRGKKYLLTRKGMQLLETFTKDLSTYLQGRKRIVLVGQVFKGLGEGSYYMSLSEYREWFRRILGFEPYPGTLNVRLDDDSISKRKELETFEADVIPAIQRGGVYYCSAKVFKAVINRSIEVGIVIPEKSVYGPDVIEIVAKNCLRDELGLKDGDKVHIEVIT